MPYKIIFSDNNKDTRYCKDDKVLEEILMVYGKETHRVVELTQQEFKREIRMATDYIMELATQQWERSR